MCRFGSGSPEICVFVTAAWNWKFSVVKTVWETKTNRFTIKLLTNLFVWLFVWTLGYHTKWLQFKRMTSLCCSCAQATELNTKKNIELFWKALDAASAYAQVAFSHASCYFSLSIFFSRSLQSTHSFFYFSKGIKSLTAANYSYQESIAFLSVL